MPKRRDDNGAGADGMGENGAFVCPFLYRQNLLLKHPPSARYMKPGLSEAYPIAASAPNPISATVCSVCECGGQI